MFWASSVGDMLGGYHHVTLTRGSREGPPEVRDRQMGDRRCHAVTKPAPARNTPEA
jgi:hypothetical protein